jgi:PAS domain S-box-containing protein
MSFRSLLVPFVAVSVATAIRIVLDTLIGDALAYSTFFAAITVAAWHGGLQPGLVATAASGLVVWLFIGAGVRDLHTADAVGLVAFCAVGALISALCESLLRAREGERVDPRRREVENELRSSQQELADFFDNASVALHCAAPDGTILRANRAELEMLGYSASEYLGHNISEFHVDGHAIGDILARLASGETLHEYPARLRCRDGSVKEVLLDSSARRQDGRFLYTRCFTTDVSQRKLTAEMTGLLAAVVASTEDAVISKTLGGRILSWNEGARTLFGFSADEAIGMSVDVLIPADEREKETQAVGRVARGERVAPFETVRIARDGRRLDVSLTLSPIRDHTGAIIGASSIARDIRQRRELEESRREADRRKDEFLAVLAHELRNPLAPIRNSVASLQMANLADAGLRGAADVIERQSGHMARLLDDLLDVSRITRNKLDLRRERVSLERVLDLALEACRPALNAAGQTASLSVPAGAVFLDADPMRLAQVFSNLINNASKYSNRRSEIRISARVVGDEISVIVADDGIGIAAETLPSLFSMFSQAAEALDRAQGGLGVGLALVKGLVELHGGRVSARSGGLGRGSEFEVRLAVAGVERPNAGSIAREIPQVAARRVLVVDDNRDAAESLAMVLRTLGDEVRTAYDGLGAIEAAQKFQPEAVLLDLGMPRMSGFETARRMRDLPGGEKTLLVAITGWGQERDRQRTLEAGFDAHFVKPVDAAAIRDYMRSAEAPQG